MNVQPNIRILHGDDEEEIENALRKIQNEQKATGLADLNFSLLDGKGLSEEALSNAVNVMPFISESRVVALKNPLSLAGGRDGNQKFLKLISSIPPSTILYLIVPDVIERKDWVLLGKTSFLRKWAEKNPQNCLIIEKKLPALPLMKDWIIKKATDMGGRIEGQAAQAMVAAIGNDTRRAVHELEKALLYVNFQRPVDIDDVQELISGSVAVSVFEMADALVAGNAKEAMTKLHRLAEEQEAQILFVMIVRQFRLLIETREILDNHGNSAIVQRDLGQMSFIADKLCRQAAAFSAAQLKEIYRQLLEMDIAFKTSQADMMTELDLFILSVSEQIRTRKNPAR